MKEEVSKINSETGGFNSGHLWQLKKKISGKKNNPMAAVMDQQGNLVTTKEEIKEVTKKHYAKVLENRTIKKGLEKHQQEREELCKLRIEASKKQVTPMWSVSDVKIVVNQLKQEEKNLEIHKIFQMN